MFLQLHFVHFVCVTFLLQADKGVMQLVLGRHNGSAPVSSYSSSNLEVKGQSYFFSFTVKSMTVTTTAKGITTKQLLIGTVTDQVCSTYLIPSSCKSLCLFPVLVKSLLLVIELLQLVSSWAMSLTLFVNLIVQSLLVHVRF